MRSCLTSQHTLVGAGSANPSVIVGSEAGYVDKVLYLYRKTNISCNVWTKVQDIEPQAFTQVAKCKSASWFYVSDELYLERLPFISRPHV